MRESKKELIEEYCRGYDFMGYEYENEEELEFHHIVVPRKESEGLKDRGYVKENGVILIRPSHEYLHRIEQYERVLFLEITVEMLKEKIRGEIRKEELYKIRRYLEEFEDKYVGKRNGNGNLIVKDRYLTKRMDFK